MKVLKSLNINSFYNRQIFGDIANQLLSVEKVWGSDNWDTLTLHKFDFKKYITEEDINKILVSAGYKLTVLKTVSKEDMEEIGATASQLANLKLPAWKLKKFMSLYKELAKNKDKFVSGHNDCVIEGIKSLINNPQYDLLPLWAKRIICENRIELPSQRGDIKNFLSTLKMWKINKYVPKKIASRLGNKPLLKKLAASVAWDIVMENELYIYSRETWTLQFWSLYNDLLKQGKVAILEQYYSNNCYYKTTLLRVISCLFGKQLTFDQQTNIAIVVESKIRYYKRNNISFNPLDFLLGLKTKPYKQIYKKFIVSESSDYWKYEACLTLPLIFGKRSLEWLHKQNKLNRGFHDSVYWLPCLPSKELKGLEEYLFKYGDRSIPDLEIISKNWITLTEDEKKLSFKELLSLCRTKRYKDIKHHKFAEEAAKWSLRESLYSKVEGIYIKSLEVPALFSTDKKWVSSSGIVLRLLPRSDVRGLFLGQYTNCCQHPEGMGSECSYYGQKNPNSGFLVAEKDARILGMSWVWSNDQDELVLDNWEAKGLSASQNNETVNLIEQMAQDLPFHKVTIGTGQSDLVFPDHWKRDNQPSKLPEDYSGYCDSRSQKIIKKEEKKQLKKQEKDYYVRGLTETDLDNPELHNIAQQVYPERWQFIPHADKGYGLILKDAMVGYCIIDTEEQEVVDIAILPQYQKTKKSYYFLHKVISFLDKGIVWKCDARASTSYKVLHSLSRKGKIDITEESANPSVYMENEPMYRVHFKVN